MTSSSEPSHCSEQLQSLSLQSKQRVEDIAVRPARRGFLKRGGALGLQGALLSGAGTGISTGLVSLLAPGRVVAKTSATGKASLDPMTRRRIHLVNAHTWDDLNVVYFTQGIYIDENISQLNHLMRDRRANKTTQMDTGLYDQLLRLQMVLGTKEPVHVLSGYRTPETNAKLRRRSKGVAKFSLHMEGRAADIYIPGISVHDIQHAALSLGAGGVGLYSKSNFVHMDTGTIRKWGK